MAGTFQAYGICNIGNKQSYCTRAYCRCNLVNLTFNSLIPTRKQAVTLHCSKEVKMGKIFPVGVFQG
jgi:hypothetical protein